jgi:hypothetical protein
VVRAWPSRFFSMSEGTCMIAKMSKPRAWEAVGKARI